MKKKFTLLVLITSCYLYSQKIEFITKNDTLEKPEYQQFIYLCEATDLTTLKLVAKVKSTGSLNNIALLFENLKNETQKLGANAFRFENFKKIDTENGELVLSTYFCNDDTFDRNFENIPKNKIYIFGNQNLTEQKIQSYKVNGNKYEITNGMYKEFQVQIGEEIKINKGGFAGATLWITGEENNSASFLSFSGIGLDGALYNPGSNAVGMNISTGRISKIEPNFGLALLKIFEQQK